MADIVHIKPMKQESFSFKDGSVLIIRGRQNSPPTVRDAVYMCEEVKLQLMDMLRNHESEETN